MQYFIYMLEHRNLVMKKFLDLSKNFLHQPRLQKNFKNFSKERDVLLPELIQICQFMQSLSKIQVGIYEGIESEKLKNIFQESDTLWKDICSSEERLVSLLEQSEDGDIQQLEKKLA
ncbi:MAG: hypothetical protein HAW60_05825 [Bdellovibrionales bacterium]|nr:hypothetical protein [Bdellovibrionales bacterium]